MHQGARRSYVEDDAQLLLLSQVNHAHFDICLAAIETGEVASSS